MGYIPLNHACGNPCSVPVSIIFGYTTILSGCWLVLVISSIAMASKSEKGVGMQA